ncbi:MULTISPECIES: menaquinone biosynthetic enzyme MqnA/MqnD family protein [Pedobacter]|uniref:Chorismate dehydratase n=1 Tax=Pedobacter heparinus (strain ATCC 13125 / DSM 2366 / CIP 104194 / JCM 7457 / NBRC 12017 / NCIMB 9290 / NRRL B-14731 / HIM 762-3) TaxID=485917 RepID=C6XW11_PEDHD|nr:MULTISPECIES: menaquinone biosynthesis protein [Pedobacter]ACU04090.1 radical SAM domain-containing protein [Pedobacter heparinus DSM 2366]MBB5436457.1 chorismate dehydratase [Pedobacter sp. AK017]
MNKIKISAVSYTNTKPFIYGIEHSALLDQIDLSLDIPTDCAAKLIDGQVDIGLIPVAAIPDVPNAHIVADYCIGSVGAVNSVFIFSKVPVAEIGTVKLDLHSRTSNHLAKVLLKFHFKQQVSYTTDQAAETDAIVLIGDRTFGRKEEFAYAYDMGQEWMNFTGLPFMYAAWVANKPIPQAFINDFNEALAFGLSKRKALLQELPEQANFDLEDYLLHKLDFELTAKKREALELFLMYITKL